MTPPKGRPASRHYPYIAGHTESIATGKLMVCCAHCTRVSFVPLMTRRLQDGPDGQPRYAKIRPEVDHLTAEDQEGLIATFRATHPPDPDQCLTPAGCVLVPSGRGGALEAWLAARLRKWRSPVGLALTAAPGRTVISPDLASRTA